MKFRRPFIVFAALLVIYTSGYFYYITATPIKRDDLHGGPAHWTYLIAYSDPISKHIPGASRYISLFFQPMHKLDVLYLRKEFWSTKAAADKAILLGTSAFAPGSTFAISHTSNTAEQDAAANP